MLFRQRLKHGENGRGTDSGADQQYGCLGPVEDVRAARRRDLELVADRESGV